jgi:hypothetical protein
VSVFGSFFFSSFSQNLFENRGGIDFHD